MSNKKTETKDVAIIDEPKTALAVGLNEEMAGALAGIDLGMTGFEGVDIDSFALPFLQLLQKMSPLVDEDSPKHVKGAKAGMFYNTVSHKLYDGKEPGTIIVPCAFKRVFVEWGGREGSDTGFKGEYTVEQMQKLIKDGVAVQKGRNFYRPDEKGEIHEKKSNYFADTRTHYVLVVDVESGEWSRVILPLASTQTKASKSLMTVLQEKRIELGGKKVCPPTYLNMVKMTTIGQSNDKGSWSAVQFQLDGLVQNRQLFEDAKKFCADINAGTVGADFSRAEHEAADVGGEGDGPTGQADNF